MSVLVCRANHVWSEADRSALESIMKFTQDEPQFLLNGVDMPVVETVLEVRKEEPYPQDLKESRWFQFLLRLSTLNTFNVKTVLKKIVRESNFLSLASNFTNAFFGIAGFALLTRSFPIDIFWTMGTLPHGGQFHGYVQVWDDQYGCCPLSFRG